MAVDTIAPILRSVTVERSPEDAFRLFTERVAEWWPLGTHSVNEEDAVDVVIEPTVGGRFYEVSNTGEESTWGEILVWEPPQRIAYTWHPGYQPGEAPTEVEVRFEAVQGGTRVDLEHRGWEALGERGETTRNGYDEGWPVVLGHFTAAAALR